MDKRFSRITPSEDLSRKIRNSVLNDITKRLVVRARIKMTASLAVLISAITASVPVVKSLAGQIGESGFWQYTSLLFSDGFSAGAKESLIYAKEIMLSIADSMPVMQIMAVLTGVLLVVISLKYLEQSLKSTRINYLTSAKI